MPDWQLVLPRWSRRATFAAARVAPDTDSATMKAVWPISKRSLGMSTEGGEDWPNWWRAEHIWRQYEDIARTILEKTNTLVISCHFYTVILYHSVILLQISRYRFSMVFAFWDSASLSAGFSKASGKQETIRNHDRLGPSQWSTDSVPRAAADFFEVSVLGETGSSDWRQVFSPDWSSHVKSSHKVYFWVSFNLNFFNISRIV
jgi:hypothetical protein